MIKNRNEVLAWMSESIETTPSKDIKEQAMSKFNITKSQATSVLKSARKSANKWKPGPKRWRLPMKMRPEKRWPHGVTTTGEWSEPKKYVKKEEDEKTNKK